MNYTDINKIFTETVNNYLNNGFTIYCNTMSGSQGEIAKVDLTNGTELYRIMLVNIYSWEDNFDTRYSIQVGKYPESLDKNNNRWLEAFDGIIWNNQLEIVSERKFVLLKENRGHRYYVEEDSEEYINAIEKRKNRIKNGYSTKSSKYELYSYIIKTEAAKKLAYHLGLSNKVRLDGKKLRLNSISGLKVRGGYNYWTKKFEVESFALLENGSTLKLNKRSIEKCEK